MTTPTELIKAVSEATGLSVPTVFDLDRRLVKGNLRPVGGRGHNAARMGPLEVARLLTAVLASPQSNAAAEAVVRYEYTRPDKARSSDALYRESGLDNLAALPARHGFVEALAALVASSATGSLQNLIASPKQMPRIEVFAFTRATHGRIRISGLPGGLTVSVEYIPVRTGEESPRSKRTGKISIDQAGDLEQSRRITERTILSVAKLLAEEK